MDGYQIKQSIDEAIEENDQAACGFFPSPDTQYTGVPAFPEKYCKASSVNKKEARRLVEEKLEQIHNPLDDLHAELEEQQIKSAQE